MSARRKLTAEKASRMDSIQIRRAEHSDARTIAGFNRAMARETENKDLIPEVVLAGVNSLFENPSRGFYIIAEVDSKAVASLMITVEHKRLTSH